MPRVASLCLAQLPIERLRWIERPRASPPEARPPLIFPVDDDPGPCSVPRGGGWRPGARWAQEAPRNRAEVKARVEALPSHSRPPSRELGRRSEAADHPFRTMRPDDGARATFLVTPDQSTPPAATPLVLALQSGQKQIVHAACPAARALGLSAGMALTYARALVPDLAIRPADIAADLAVMERIARHAVRHWTPTASVAAPDGLWLDLAGTTHLFGGEERFCHRLIAFLRRLGLTATIAITDTPGASHALARFGADPVIIVPPGRLVQAIAALPVEALRLDTSALTAARRFGLDRIADLIPLPRAPLARRLGRDAIVRLDQALGRIAEPILPLLVEEAPVAERRLLDPIITPEAIGQVIIDIVGDLVGLLRERGLGARSLWLALLRVDGTEQRLAIGLARATREAKHLTRLLLLRLENIDPGMGIEIMRLTAVRAERLDAQPLAISLAGDEAADDLAPLADQLAGRVGDKALFRCTMSESDVPERAVRLIGPLDQPRGWPAWKRPVRLLRRPEPLDNVVALLPDQPPRRFVWRGTVHEVVAGDGPERIHGEWWVRDGEVWAVRDYFRVEDRAGGRFWVFRRGDGVERDTGDLSWWMHGAFG